MTLHKKIPQFIIAGTLLGLVTVLAGCSGGGGGGGNAGGGGSPNYGVVFVAPAQDDTVVTTGFPSDNQDTGITDNSGADPNTPTLVRTHNPEPSTLLLLGVGLAFLARKSLKNKRL